MNSPPLLRCAGLCKAYKSGGGAQTILRDAALTVHAGESIAIVGASGSGKTTLLHILGGLDSPDAGDIFYNDERVTDMSDSALTRWRNTALGFIFQFHLLLPEFTAQENIAMPLLLRRMSKRAALDEAQQLLAAVNLAQHGRKTPDKLSGGERQRAAVARALAGKPKIVLADEPTGNLDRANAADVFRLLTESCRQNNAALIIVSHDHTLAAQTDRTLLLEHGALSPFSPSSSSSSSPSP